MLLLGTSVESALAGDSVELLLVLFRPPSCRPSHNVPWESSLFRPLEGIYVHEHGLEQHEQR